MTQTTAATRRQAPEDAVDDRPAPVAPMTGRATVGMRSGCDGHRSASRRHADAVAGDPPDEQPGDDVEGDRHDQQDEPEGDQRRGLETDRRLVERRRDLGRDRLTLVEQAASGSAGLLPMTIVTAIVSPSARPRPRMTAPTIPERAYGRTAFVTVSQRVAPRASIASRCAVRDGRDDLARDRHDGRQDHDREDHAGREDARPRRSGRRRTG